MPKDTNRPSRPLKRDRRSSPFGGEPLNQRLRLDERRPGDSADNPIDVDSSTPTQVTEEASNDSAPSSPRAGPSIAQTLQAEADLEQLLSFVPPGGVHQRRLSRDERIRELAQELDSKGSIKPNDEGWYTIKSPLIVHLAKIRGETPSMVYKAVKLSRTGAANIASNKARDAERSASFRQSVTGGRTRSTAPLANLHMLMMMEAKGGDPSLEAQPYDETPPG